MSAARPDTTHADGAFTTDSHRPSASRFRTRSGGSGTASMTPSGIRSIRLTAERDQRQRVIEIEHASQARRHELADAVADARLRLDAPRHPEARQRVLDDEERRLRVARASQRLGRLGDSGVAG